MDDLTSLVQQLQAENTRLQQQVASLRQVNQSLQAELERSQPPPDLQQMDAVLRQSKSTNQAILKAIPDLLMRIGRDGTCSSFLPPSRGGAGIFLPVEHHLAEVLPPDLLANQLQQIEQALTTGDLQVWEQQLVKQGQLCHEEVRLVPCSDNECLVIVRDITQRKQMELALEAKIEELDRFFSVALDLLCIADTDGYFRRLNSAWEKTLGYGLAELENTPFISYVHLDDVTATIEAVSALANHQEIVSFTNRYRCLDGSYRWLEWRSVPVDGLIYAAARDVTAMVDMQQALQTSEMQLSSILNSSVDGIMAFRAVRDDRGTIVDFAWLLSNPAACAMVGRTAEYLTGKRLLEELPDHQANGLFDLGVQVIETGEPMQQQFEYSQNQINAWFENAAVKLDDGFAVTFHDITALKQSTPGSLISKEVHQILAPTACKYSPGS